MTITERTYWRILDADDDPITETYFHSPEAARVAATAYLLELAEGLPLSGFFNFANTTDEQSARKTVGVGTWSMVKTNRRWTSAPRVRWSEDGGCGTLERLCELQATVTETTTKTVEVDGETFSRPVQVVRGSEWFPGESRHTGLARAFIQETTLTFSE